jgi:hypothetical protein
MRGKLYNILMFKLELEDKHIQLTNEVLNRINPPKMNSQYQNYSYTPYAAPSASGCPVLGHLCLPHPADVQFLSAPQKETDRK